MRRLATTIVSAFIVLVLALQTITGLSLSGGRLRPSPYLWPFMDYPMYGNVHYEGDAIDRWAVFVEFEDGQEREMDAGDFDLNFWIFQREIVHGLLDADADRLRPFVDAYAELHGHRPVAMRLESRPYIVRRDRLEPGDPVVVGSVRLDTTAETAP